MLMRRLLCNLICLTQGGKHMFFSDPFRGHNISEDDDEDSAGDVTGLFIAFVPPHTLGGKLFFQLLFSGFRFLCLTWPWREGGEGISRYSRRQWERWDRSVYLGKLIDWEERWCRGERKKIGGRDTGGWPSYPHLFVLIKWSLLP